MDVERTIWRHDAGQQMANPIKRCAKSTSLCLVASMQQTNSRLHLQAVCLQSLSSPFSTCARAANVLSTHESVAVCPQSHQSTQLQ